MSYSKYIKGVKTSWTYCIYWDLWCNLRIPVDRFLKLIRPIYWNSGSTLYAEIIPGVPKLVTITVANLMDKFIYGMTLNFYWYIKIWIFYKNLLKPVRTECRIADSDPNGSGFDQNTRIQINNPSLKACTWAYSCMNQDRPEMCLQN